MLEVSIHDELFICGDHSREEKRKAPRICWESAYIIKCLFVEIIPERKKSKEEEISFQRGKEAKKKKKKPILKEAQSK